MTLTRHALVVGSPILIVDDAPDSALFLAKVMQRWGYPVEVVHDGQSALEIVGRFLPKGIFIDLGMPDMDGFELCQVLRQRNYVQESIVVAVTGYGDPTTLAKCIEVGFDRHLLKPVGLEKLRAIFGPKLAGHPDYTKLPSPSAT